MTIPNVLRYFVAGMAFPALMLTIFYTLLFFSDNAAVQSEPLQFMPLMIPLLFGITNVIYGAITKGQTCRKRLWLSGIVLGLVVATVGILILKLPTKVFGVSPEYSYVPFIVLPIAYGLIFRYIVRWLNKVLGAE